MAISAVVESWKIRLVRRRSSFFQCGTIRRWTRALPSAWNPPIRTREMHPATAREPSRVVSSSIRALSPRSGPRATCSGSATTASKRYGFDIASTPASESTSSPSGIDARCTVMEVVPMAGSIAAAGPCVEETDKRTMPTRKRVMVGVRSGAGEAKRADETWADLTADRSARRPKGRGSSRRAAKRCSAWEHPRRRRRAKLHPRRARAGSRHRGARGACGSRPRGPRRRP